MKTTNVRVATTLLALFLALSVFPSTANAAPPVTTIFEISDVDEVVLDCGEFLIIGNYTGTFKETVHFDKDGDPTRIVAHGRATGTLANSETGYTLDDAPTIANFFIDLETGVVAHVGVDFQITVPGAGVVVLQAGKIVFDGPGPPIFVAGPHLGPPDIAAAVLCGALDH